MKMDFFFTNMFWGILIILFGLSVFLKGFNIHLPLVKVFLAIIIIMFGVRLLIGGRPTIKISRHHYGKGSSLYYNSHSKEYTMAFASGTIDFSDLPQEADDFEITVVFGSATVILPDDLNFTISPTSVFGATYLPPHKRNQGGKSIEIESSAVFGRLEYIFKTRPGNAGTVQPDSTQTAPGDAF